MIFKQTLQHLQSLWHRLRGEAPLVPSTGQANPAAAGAQNPPQVVQNLMRSVERTLERELACQEVYQLVGQYAEMAAAGEPAEKLMPLVAQHMEMCPDCREEYEALLQVLKAQPSSL